MTFIMKNKEKIRLIIFSSIYFLTIAILLSTNYYFFKSSNTSIKQINTLSAKEIVLKKDLNHLTTKFSETEKALIDLQNQDQLKINQNLTEEIKNINTTYNSSVKTYENLLDLKSISKKTENFDKTFAEILSLLSEKNYISASALLAQLDKDIKTESDKISSSFVIPQNVKAVDAVIASQPMLLSGGNVTFSGDSESKRASKGNRSFIGNKGNTVYIGVVHNASVYDVAQVLKKMGLENALNLDSGVSTAFYTNGHFVAGPGRDLPFGIVLVHK